MPGTGFARVRGHARSHRDSAVFKADAVPVGAGAPANTGGAGAKHRSAYFAGKPAPTGIALYSRLVQYLWERARPRTPA
ncbi:Sensory box protein/GGDEF family protein (modular protein) [Pseudomonas sp. JV551A1]|uniref:Sensory box protein/GGDEF family protein (Modular protein) n=1 Tax=Pseudomonas inefficax TaxID=2078786 RepID=A0AAQ1P3S0_9PSED|nr:Sensory box protein/GGDEF family protein (modular protein) [Pseudomonas sp. JV551A1]SPO58433.1 Sensory box protein/GGDEF family protein (modular protein) [Pseudomonas inefficax]